MLKTQLLEIRHIESLEHIIDRYDVPSVLKAIDQICIEKAEHIRTNWQDEKKTARSWGHIARYVDTAARQTANHI